MPPKGVRWDWVVVTAGFFIFGLLAFAGGIWPALAVVGAYVLGRWDSDYGQKYR